MKRPHIHINTHAQTQWVRWPHRRSVSPGTRQQSVRFSTRGPASIVRSCRFFDRFLLISFKWTIMVVSPAVTRSHPTTTTTTISLFFSLITHPVGAVNYTPYRPWLLYLLLCCCCRFFNGHNSRVLHGASGGASPLQIRQLVIGNKNKKSGL